MEDTVKATTSLPEEKKSKLEIIEEALLKNITGGNTDTCGSDAGNNCWHDTCYTPG